MSPRLSAGAVALEEDEEAPLSELPTINRASSGIERTDVTFRSRQPSNARTFIVESELRRNSAAFSQAFSRVHGLPDRFPPFAIVDIPPNRLRESID